MDQPILYYGGKIYNGNFIIFKLYYIYNYTPHYLKVVHNNNNSNNDNNNNNNNNNNNDNNK